MSLSHASLPSDLAELRAFALNLQAENATVKNEAAALQAELYAKTLYIEKLKSQLSALRRERFGRSSEKLDHEIAQLELLIGTIEDDSAGAAQSEDAAALPAAPHRERMQSVRRPLAAHLPRERVEHGALCACPSCGGMAFSVIGKDEREVLEYVPSHFKVIVHVRPKLSCRACETIMQPAMPSLPIERGLPGAGLLAHVLVSKYADHLPLYRQAAIYARDGVDIDRSTMGEWVAQMGFLLGPLAEEIARHVRAGETIHADDTPVPVLDPGRGRTKTGRLWVALRDERPWGSGVPPAVFYRYAPDRKKEQARALLRDCRGYLHADAYDGFKDLYDPHPVTGEAPLAEVACWAHARRYIYKIHETTASPAAKALLDQIAALFAIEAGIRGKTASERLAARSQHAVPLLAQLKAGMESALAQVSRKSDFAEALRYALSRWDSFTRYTMDGRLEISNNAVERAIRPLAIGRKNWMFAGSDRAGERAGVIYTLIETAKMNGIDPQAYLRTVIARIADHPIKRIAELLPWNVSL